MWCRVIKLAGYWPNNYDSLPLPIKSLKLTSVDITIDPKKINEEFESFYTLYFEKSFTPLKIPLVYNDMVEMLDMPITTNELSIAITSMQGGKCPGPDGYPKEFYRKFQTKLAPVFIDMLHESFATLS